MGDVIRMEGYLKAINNIKYKGPTYPTAKFPAWQWLLENASAEVWKQALSEIPAGGFPMNVIAAVHRCRPKRGATPEEADELAKLNFLVHEPVTAQFCLGQALNDPEWALFLYRAIVEKSQPDPGNDAT